MDQAPFRFVDLDYVVIREVLKTLDPIDYINFSKASKSCKRLSTIKTRYKVSLTFTDRPAVWIGTGPVTYVMKWTDNSLIDGSRWTETCQGKSWKRRLTYSENPLSSMKEFYLYARSLMGVELDFVLMNMDDYRGECREIVDWLRSNCLESSALSVLGERHRREELQYALDNLKLKDSLKIRVTTIEQLPLVIPESIEELHITYGSWVTIEYVMSLKMRNFTFHGTKLANQELNVFYKSWIEMKSHQSLEYFEVNLTDEEDFVAVGLRGIPYEMGPPRPGPFNTYRAEGGSFEITRDDGLTATICVFQYGFLKFVAIMYTELLKVV
ncbi:hypothetical protein B9Z55_011314 [Caenorhabditis nigoni]|uniref:Uncharacterized protein n=2 Tax=Caenorhabditis nigoni TaxID=1611254 RepID=A0A2G5UJJ8_9PELO|nr:hypothetical protein B9Z55_011314 [Caenorhabditis nigoni]